MTRHTFGASDTNIFDNLSSGALSALGGKENVKAAFDLARALTPQPEPVDPALLSFLFFSKMAEEASKPGSTALGAAGAAATSPASYLMQRRKAEREAEASIPTTALSLAKLLKPDAGSVTYRPATAEELKRYGATAGQMGSDGKFYDLSPSSTSSDNTRMDVILKGVTDDPKTAINESITSILRSEFDPDKHLPASALSDESSKETGPLTQLAKLYADLEKAPIGSEQRDAIQTQINAEITKSGFDKDLFEAENKILTDYNKRTKELVEAEIAYNKLAEARDARDGVGDLAMVFSFMKMLDPGSVVRESEFSAAQNTAGLFQKLQVAAESIKKGDLLSEQQRENFLELSKKFLEAGRIHMAKIRLDKGLQVQNYGLNPVNIFGSEIAPPLFYLDEEVFNAAKGAGITPTAMWLTMSDEEKAKYFKTGD
mgnify:FL=1